MLGLIAVVSTLSIGAGCTPTIPEGRLSCGSSADCPGGWECRDDHCYLPGAETDGGPRIDVPGLDAPGRDAPVSTDGGADSPGPGCVASEDCPADDGLLCTALPDCVGGRCRYPLRAGTCLISGACYGEGEHLGERTGMLDPCLVCDPTNPNELSPDPDAACGAGAFCTEPGTCNAAGNCVPGPDVCPGSCDETANVCLCTSAAECPFALPPEPCAPPSGQCTAARTVTAVGMCGTTTMQCEYAVGTETCALPLRTRCGDETYTCPDGSIRPAPCRICLGPMETRMCEVDAAAYNDTCLPRCAEIARLCGAGTAFNCAGAGCPPDSALVSAADTTVCCLGATRCGP